LRAVAPLVGLVAIGLACGLLPQLSFFAAGLGTGVLLVVGLVFVVPGLIPGRPIELFDHGLVIGGRSPQTVFFDDVDELYVDFDVVGTHLARAVTFTIVTHAKSKFRFGRGLGVQDMADLHNHLRRVLTLPLVHEARQALTEGQALRFGPLTPTHEVLRAGRRSIPWSSLVHARTTPSMLYFKKRGWPLWWARIKLADVPHWAALLALLGDKLEVKSLREER
jgi:hypothetical protein